MKEKPTSRQETFSHLDYLDIFTHPLLDQTIPEPELTGHYDHTVVVGRFQPLHYGHLYLIQQALRVSDSLTIGIGSANVINSDNPFSPQEREYMLCKALKRNRTMDKIKKIVYLDDNPNDMTWVKRTINKVGKVKAVVGNNEWVNDCFDIVGIPAVTIPLLTRNIFEGKKIREYLRALGKIA